MSNFPCQIQITDIRQAFVPVQLSPVITFGIFVAISSSDGQGLDTTRIFTSLSLLLLLASPLSQLFQAISQMFAAVACISRIQNFLEAEPRGDHRLVDAPESSIAINLPPSAAGSNIKSRIHDDVELVNMKSLPKVSVSGSNDRKDVIRVRDGSFGWKQDEAPVLNDMNFNIAPGSLTIIVGPVACGKTTLLKSLLGETPSSKGFVHVSTLDFSFCDQTPWLLSQSIQKNVIGFAPLDPIWYKTVIHASCLIEDIELFPNGDDTLVGSNGISLSGGQKQRLAIARAVYARKTVAIFDDVFSGLDKTTEKKVFDRLFGSSGVLRRLKTTCVIATHAIDILPFADQIIALDSHGRIVEHGTFRELNSRGGYISSFSLSVRDTSAYAEDSEHNIPALAKEEALLIDELADQKRQTGDFTLYAYYLKAAGWLSSSLFLFYSCLLAFFETFPSR